MESVYSVCNYFEIRIKDRGRYIPCLLYCTVTGKFLLDFNQTYDDTSMLILMPFIRHETNYILSEVEFSYTCSIILATEVSPCIILTSVKDSFLAQAGKVLFWKNGKLFWRRTVIPFCAAKHD